MARTKRTTNFRRSPPGWASSRRKRKTALRRKSRSCAGKGICTMGCHGNHTNQDDLWAEFNKQREDWRARRDARREEWRARREERRNRWAHLGDPAFWGLDEESLRAAGMPPNGGQAPEVKELKERVASMEETIEKLSQRI